MIEWWRLLVDYGVLGVMFLAQGVVIRHLYHRVKYLEELRAQENSARYSELLQALGRRRSPIPGPNRPDGRYSITTPTSRTRT